jgi:hypothetical protein
MPNVTVSSPAVIQVKVNPQQSGEVKSLNYGIRSLIGSTDLSMAGATDSDVITYQANTNSFIIKSVTDAITDLDAGFF